VSTAEAHNGPGATPEVPVVWGNVPQRNKNFTGRVDLLGALRTQVTSEVTVVLAHALHGMGGVGKTQLAIEYAYRYASDYQVIWWIPADQIPLVRSSLAALAPRLGLDDVAPGRVEDAVSAVLDALRRGQPFDRWLVIFDNADQPEEIRDLIPTGTGHVIVTSRNHRWQSVADVVEVDVFTRQESLDFLSRRVPNVGADAANRLSEELGDLPLALEQAAALQVESGMSVDEYLELLAKESSKVLAENPPADYPVPVAAAWSLSVARLQEQMPFAWELLRRLAFFGPEPIQRDLLKNGRYVLGPPLQADLGDAIMLSRATRELGRYALARVDNNRRTLQIHRLIQKLIRDDIDIRQAGGIRHEAHLLLAAADPDEPDDPEDWPRYDELLAHIVPSEVLGCTGADPRRLVRNVVRYLFVVGDLRTCDALSSEALDRWTAQSGPDDVDVLVLAGQRAALLWTQGDYAGAYELRTATLERMREVLGEDHEATLHVTNMYGADLRARGDFAAALELDGRTLERHLTLFGDDDPRTLMMTNNVAIDQALNGDYVAAYATDTRTHQDRLDLYGRNDHPWVIHSLAAMGRDLRQGGRYKEALELEEQAYAAFSDLVRQRVLPADHHWVLLQAKDLAAARRKMGQIDEALALSEEVYQKFMRSFGERHPDTLDAAMNLGNAMRVKGDVEEDHDLMVTADAQLAAAFELYSAAYGDDHPCSHGCAFNLAVVRRRIGREREALDLVANALAGFQRRLGDEHHYTLTCMTAVATTLAETGDPEQAVVFGERALEGLRNGIGPVHPHTLACAVNLAIDLRTVGQHERADSLGSAAMLSYREQLPPDHFDVIDAEAGERIVVDFEAPLL
jgi:tetratricopeptide (TPR) repeat protein